MIWPSLREEGEGVLLVVLVWNVSPGIMVDLGRLARVRVV